MSIVKGHLDVPQPFCLGLTLEMGQAFRWRRLPASGERPGDGDRPPDQTWYSGVLGEYLIHLRQCGSRVEYRATALNAVADETAVEILLRDYFRLGDDVPAIYADFASGDVHLARLVEKYGGMRLLRQDPWECTAAYLCSANNNVVQISRIVERIASEFGGAVNLGDDVRNVFPGPERLAHPFAEERLCGMKLGLKRATKIVAAARVILAEDLDLHGLREQPYAVAKSVVRKLPGAGDKIADCIALFSLDQTGAFPLDRHIGRALAIWPDCPFPQDARSLRPSDYRATVAWAQERFGPYAGYAGQLMFCDQRKRG